MICLTSPFSRDYAFHTSANSEAGIGVSEAKADNRRRAVFLRPQYDRHPLWVARVGSRKTRRSFARYANPHESAHPIGVGEADNLNRLQRSHTMRKAFKRASAHKFIVISATPHFTDYVGTKEELISFGFAVDHHFPVGRKRVVYAPDLPDNLRPLYFFKMTRIKGGRFEFRKFREHQERPEQSSQQPLKHFEICAHTQGTGYSYKIKAARGIDIDDEMDAEVRIAIQYLIDAVKAAKLRSSKNPPYLKLVEPMTATGGR